MRPHLTSKVVALCQSEASISSELAKNPSLAPGDMAKKIFGEREPTGKPSAHGDDALTRASPADLEQALRCGRWGPTQPGELFARAFHDVLCCLEADPLGGMVSPSLLGSYGTVPLSVIAPLIDIVRHMANVIVRARTEVLFATCSWSPSDAVDLVSDALRELSRRAGERGERVVVKIIYDKATIKQIFKHHQKLDPDFYSGEKVKLPHPSEVPNLDMEVSSLHVPPLGTLHSKFMVVDRQIALVESNNMENNSNMEMMTHLEGPIVDSLYDCFLMTWNEKMTPPLPSYNSPARIGGIGNSSAGKPQYPTNGDARSQQQIAEDGLAAKAQLAPLNPGDPHYDDDISGEISRVQAMYSPQGNETRIQAINRHLNQTSKSNAAPSVPDIEPGDEFTPYISHTTDLVPIALVSRRPHGPMSNSDAFVPQNEAFLSLIRNAQTSIFIQTPDLNATHLHQAILDAVKRGVDVTYYVCLGYNDAGEMMPGQGGTNETFASNLYKELSDDERPLLSVHWYTAKDQSKPIAHSFKQRTCHIKILIADGRVGIQGSGNQDTQSWYHSQEVNIMVDSEVICREWREGIERNQNTDKYGKGSQEDGVWRDAQGHEVPGATEESAPPISWIKGTIGMAKKLKDKGGF
ncbi:hypothetical protein BX600DRAFT_476429 [Xylariales sp. PMI_506]|nr:hypothetical protein BX600DRAFT_476429 [Xylariales sp. PMI_506]